MYSFAAELRRAEEEGTFPAENLPFLLEPQQANGKAVLLIHGFSASPQEMRPLGSRLCELGYLTLGIRLAGHGTSPEELRRYQWQDWYRSVLRGYEILHATGLPVDMVAQSTGALLGLELAANKPLHRAALLSPFLKLYHPLGRFAGWLKHLIPYQQRDVAAGQSRYHYARRPLSGIEQILLLARHVEPRLPRIKTPTLVLTAQEDRTVDSESGHLLFTRLGSSEKKFHRFGPPAPHDLSSDENPFFDETFARIRDFLTTDS